MKTFKGKNNEVLGTFLENTDVVVNPTLVGDEPNLEGLEVEGNKYKVPQGGGGTLYKNRIYIALKTAEGGSLDGISYVVYSSNNLNNNYDKTISTETFNLIMEMISGVVGANETTVFNRVDTIDDKTTFFGVSQLNKGGEEGELVRVQVQWIIDFVNDIFTFKVINMDTMDVLYTENFANISIDIESTPL